MEFSNPDNIISASLCTKRFRHIDIDIRDLSSNSAELIDESTLLPIHKRSIQRACFIKTINLHMVQLHVIRTSTTKLHTKIL